MSHPSRKYDRVAWAVMTGLLVSPVASAQVSGAAASPSALGADELAKEQYLRGDRLYAEGSYAEAVRAFERAFELSGRPALLYNMANALERLGRYPEAIRRLQDYSPSAPEGQRPIILKRIEALSALAEEQRRVEAERSAAGAAASGNGAGGRDAEVPPDDSVHAPPVLGYVVGGGGLLGIGLGVVLGVSAASARRDAEALCRGDGEGELCPVSARGPLSDTKILGLAADIAFGLGTVGLGIGLYLVLDAGSESGAAESGATTKVEASATPGGGVMSVVHAF